MERFGTYSENDFLAICKMLDISDTSSGSIGLREKFKRVFAGEGTAEENAHVTELLEQLRKGTPQGR